MMGDPIKVSVGDTIEVNGVARFVCTDLQLNLNLPPKVEFKTPLELMMHGEDMRRRYPRQDGT